MGDVTDFRNFMGAVIDKRAFDKISEYIEHGAQQRDRSSPAATTDGEDGLLHRARRWSRPTDPGYRLLCEEIFGPVVTAHVYDDARWEETLEVVDADFALRADRRGLRRDRRAVREASLALRNAAGNFYINDKPTGAVVGQQPFGGARGSGTNDKAGSKLNLVRWVSARTIKETFSPPTRLPLSVHGRGG